MNYEIEPNKNCTTCNGQGVVRATIMIGVNSPKGHRDTKVSKKIVTECNCYIRRVALHSERNAFAKNNKIKPESLHASWVKEVAGEVVSND